MPLPTKLDKLTFLDKKNSQIEPAIKIYTKTSIHSQSPPPPSFHIKIPKQSLSIQIYPFIKKYHVYCLLPLIKKNNRISFHLSQGFKLWHSKMVLTAVVQRWTKSTHKHQKFINYDNM